MGIDVKSKMSDMGKKFEEAIKNINTTSAKVGWFGMYPPGEDGASKSVGEVAIQNEFGGKTKTGQAIPARPFLRPTIDSKQNKWMATLTTQVKKVLRGDGSMERALMTTGVSAQEDIRNTIASIWEPPLSEFTIKARLAKRGFVKDFRSDIGNFNRKLSKQKIKEAAGREGGSLIDKPLIDTGIFINSITTVIEKS